MQDEQTIIPVSYSQIDRALSKALGDMVGAENRQCYMNAWRVVKRRGVKNANYVEGLAMLPEFGYLTFEHAWVMIDGVVVDPTPIWHEDLKNASYFAVLTLPKGTLGRLRGFPVWLHDQKNAKYYARCFSRIQSECYRAVGMPELADLMDQCRATYDALSR